MSGPVYKPIAEQLVSLCPAYNSDHICNIVSGGVCQYLSSKPAFLEVMRMDGIERVPDGVDPDFVTCSYPYTAGKTYD